MILIAGVLALQGATASAENWPQWRGPRADGTSRDRGFPVEWSRERKVSWRAPLPGRGASTPIVWEDLVFLTLQIGEGPMEQRVAREQGTVAPWERDYAPGDSVRFLVLAYHRDDGRLAWSYSIETAEPLPEVYPTHNLASPSVTTDGERLYAWFGTGLLLALSLDGKLLWQRPLGRELFAFRVQRGHGSSPVLYEDSLFLLVDHTDAAVLLCLDKRTGEERFRIDRGRDRRSYTTPVVVSFGGRDEIVINSSERIDAYDPKSGRFLWHAGGPVELAIPHPVFHEGILYTNRGYTSSPYLAVRAGGEGDVTETHVLWQEPTRGAYVSSMLFHEGLLYMATERGIASVVEEGTGRTLWRERIGGVYTASPVVAENRIYFLNEGGETVVLAAGPKPEILARNELGERCLASPALSRGTVFIRSDEHLFAIGAVASGGTDAPPLPDPRR